jgi:glycosyltransferase involved in cell wall biosynthesis
VNLSIIIPTLNEASNISQTLQSIRRQRVREAFEVIVVDGGSTDTTIEQAAKFGVTVLISPERGKVAQLNYAAKQAQGEILCFLDADTLLPENYLARIKQFFVRHPNVLACGTRFKYVNRSILQWRLGQRNFTITNYEPLSWFIALWYLVRDLFHFTELPGCNMCVRRNAFLAIGGLPPVQIDQGIDAAFSFELRRLIRTQGRGRLRYLFSPPVLTSARHLSWARSSKRLKQIHRYVEGQQNSKNTTQSTS